MRTKPMSGTCMNSQTPKADPPAIDAVLAALDRLTGDLRHRVEKAENRAEMERQAREAEAEARHAAEVRAAVAEQSARDAVQRAEAAETAAKESIEQLRRDLLAAIKEAGTMAQAAVRPDRYSAERPEDPYHLRQDQLLPHIPQPRAGRMSRLSQLAPPHRNEAEHAWDEDEPAPSQWRRLFRRWRK